MFADDTQKPNAIRCSQVVCHLFEVQDTRMTQVSWLSIKGRVIMSSLKHFDVAMLLLRSPSTRIFQPLLPKFPRGPSMMRLWVLEPCSNSPNFRKTYLSGITSLFSHSALNRFAQSEQTDDPMICSLFCALLFPQNILGFQNNKTSSFHGGANFPASNT
jgi:hypothetical protein